MTGSVCDCHSCLVRRGCRAQHVGMLAGLTSHLAPGCCYLAPSGMLHSWHGRDRSNMPVKQMRRVSEQATSVLCLSGVAHHIMTCITTLLLGSNRELLRLTPKPHEAQATDAVQHSIIEGCLV